MNAIRLRTEYLRDPIGIDYTTPRLQWNCSGGVKQTAYQIIAEKDGSLVWDSGKVESDSMAAVYNGAALHSRDCIMWRVRLWDETGTQGEWSETASFELGLLQPTDWQAAWITGDYVPKTKKSLVGDYMARKCERYPVDCFAREFGAGSIIKARLYITACGVYEARINGAKVGNQVLTPGHTDYRKRVQYQTYDVTALIKEGKNRLTVELADGWYRGRVGAWGLLCQYGDTTKLLAQLELTAADGSITRIVTDESWQWSNDGPICFADNRNGEIVDARCTPSYSGKAKRTVHNVVPTASNNVPVLEHEQFKPTVITTPSGKTVLDFGQNIAGYVAFGLQAKAGQRVFMRFGEMLDKDGEFTQKNFQCVYKEYVSPLQQVEYLCKNGVNEYKTKFSVFGFQYILLETDVAWQPEDFTAIAVYSDLERTGFFESSNKLLDQFVENTVWSAKGNFLDVPTDCPTRERHGWTGDAQLFGQTACYLFNYYPFAEKYLNDVYDAQEKNGCLPQIAPVGGTDFYMKVMDGSVGWADVGVLLPYVLWKTYNDVAILEKYYSKMQKYATFMQKRCGKKTLLSKPLPLHGKSRRYAVNYGQIYGEWAEPTDVYPTKWTDMALPHPEESTAYTSYIMGKMAEIADALGKQQDAKDYRAWERNVRDSYQQLIMQPDFSLNTERQAKLVRPLYMGLLNKTQAAYAQKRLLEALEHYGWRLGTGFLSTPLILYVLASYDLNAAYRLLENEQMPGWLFMPKSGANTVWESWEGTQAQSGIASLNHYSKGAVCEWLFTTMCGITLDGKNHFAIAPHPGGHFTHAKAAYQSVYGCVESGWQRENGKTVYTVVVPANCTAAVKLPSGAAYSVAAGTHTWEETA